MNYLIEQLQRENIKFKDSPYWGIYFRKRWEEAFVSHLNQSEKEKIYLYGDRYSCGYLWHVFRELISFKLPQVMLLTP